MLLVCSLFFFSFSFPFISNKRSNVWHPSLVLSSAFLEMCNFRMGGKGGSFQGVGVGSCGQCFLRLSRNNCSREVENRISRGGGAVKTIAVEVVDGKQ